MRHLKQVVYLILVLVLGTGLFSTVFSKTEINVIPKPNKIVQNSGSFTLSADTRIVADNEPQIQYCVNYLLEGLKPFQIQPGVEAKRSAKKNQIILLLSGDKSNEAYSLSISEKGVEIKAADPSGLFYGVVTLLQLLPSEAKPMATVEIPAVTIEDSPRFEWRGMHLDVCRHFYPVEFVKRYIDLLAMHKMNVFHWHLTEDQGWRIEIKKYPKLTEVGAWRVDREHQHWNDRTPPNPGEEATYGGYYTQEQIKDVIKYAQERFITIVPEIEMPGHAVAALASYPELSCTGGPFYVMPGGYWPITDIYCAGKEETFEFLENVLDEVIALFPGTYIHIGGDEANKANWEKCPDCQARIKSEGLKDEAELQSYFIKRIEKYLISKNKRLIGWDEILEGGLAPEATVMSWRGIEGGIEAASQGHDVVMTPTSWCYFDYYQSKDNEPLAIGGFLPLRKVYNYDPVPNELERAKRKHVLGAQGNIWTEYMPNGRHVEYMAVPRMSAMSEVVWTAKKLKDWEDFQSRMLAQYDRLDAMGVNYHQPDIQGYKVRNVFPDSLLVELSFVRPNAVIRYTLDGSQPGLHSPVYEKPILIDKDVELKSAAFINDRYVSRIKCGSFMKREPAQAVKVSNPKNGVAYTYIPGSMKTVRNLETVNFVESGTQKQVALPDDTQDEAYGLIYKGYIDVPKTGLYTFYLTSNDGSAMYLNDELIIDHDGEHSAIDKDGFALLGAGKHPFKIYYFQAGGGKELILEYEGPGTKRQVVPASALSH